MGLSGGSLGGSLGSSLGAGVAMGSSRASWTKKCQKPLCFTVFELATPHVSRHRLPEATAGIRSP